ncbi:hypothetical protein PFISCL1PPCAC_22978, partial [Pristionchus fissidentatus]
FTKGSHHVHKCIAGPSGIIMKVVKEEDSFEQFAQHHATNAEWEESLKEHRTEALLRDDPFGATEFLVPYSMDKKKRWLIPDIAGDEIDNDPSRSLRVSLSVHACSTSGPVPMLQRPPWGWESGTVHIEALPTEQYHDVLRDGTVVHSVHEQARLHTLDRSEPKSKFPYARTFDPANMTKNLPFDSTLQFQKAHVRYNIMKMVNDKRPVYALNNPLCLSYYGSYDAQRIHGPKYDQLRWEIDEVEGQFTRDDESNDVIDVAEPEAVISAPGKWTLGDFIVDLPEKRRRRRGKMNSGGNSDSDYEIVERIE